MPNLLQRMFPKFYDGTKEMHNESTLRYITGKGNMFSEANAESISTVYTCIKILSDTIARLPLNIYTREADGSRLVDKDDYRYSILHYNPNRYTTSQAFFGALEYHRNLKGNAFARIHRNRKTAAIEWLEILKPSQVVGFERVDNELYYLLYHRDKVGEEREVVPADDILHFKMVTRDGIWGVNPVEALRLNLSTTWKGLKTIDTFYENNAVAAKALKSSVPDAARLKKQREAVDDFKEKYSGPSRAGELIVLPEYTEIQDLSLSMADAEFISTIKFNSNQIAAAYGVPPHLVGNYEASKFNNVEQLQLNFKANTMDAIARMYRQELEFKLLTAEERSSGKSIEFNFMAFVETDANTRFSGYKTLHSLGTMTPNQIAILEGLPTFKGGDHHFIPANYMSIEVYDTKNGATPNTETDIEGEG